MVAFNEENAPLLGAVCDAAAGDRRDGKYDNPVYSWLHATITGLLEQAVAQGDLSCPNVACTADSVLAALCVDLYLFQRHERGFSAERIVRGTPLRQDAHPVLI